MLPALYDDQRELLLRLAVMVVLGSLCVLPMTVPESGTVRAEVSAGASVAPEPKVPIDLPVRSVALRRDPFMPVGTAAVGTLQASGDDGTPADIVLPPNAGANGIPSDARGGVAVPLVRAVVLGPHPRALIDLAGSVSVYGVGDRLGSSAISRIDAAGVELASGVRLPVVQGAR